MGGELKNPRDVDHVTVNPVRIRTSLFVTFRLGNNC